MNHTNLDNHLTNGLDSDHSSSLNSFDEVESNPTRTTPDEARSFDDFMNLENIDLAINHVSNLLSFDRNLNGMVLPREDLDDTLVRGVEARRTGDQMNSLCQQLLQLLENGEDLDNRVSSYDHCCSIMVYSRTRLVRTRDI